MSPPETPRTQTLREEFLNLPNMLTMLRILLIPPVMILMLSEPDPDTVSAGRGQANFFAAVLFGLAAVTDGLDGYLARKRNMVSLLGKLLDPLADKLIVMATLVVAAQLEHIPSWFVVLLLSREIAITGLRSIAGQEGLMVEVVRAGKIKTALQLIGLICLILHYRYVIHFGFAEAEVDFNALGVALLALSMVFSLVSAGIYFVRFLRAVAEQRSGGG